MQLGILKELILYRYRYILAYSVLIVICAALTLWQLDAIPPGFSVAEMNSAVAASHLQLQSIFVDAPYIALQKLSLYLFDVGTLGVRLPSVICAITMVIASYIFLRRWFKESMAIIGTLLIVTSAHFLLRGRTGSPIILYSLWPMLLLAASSLVIDRTKAWRFWLWCIFVVLGLMMYTPYLGYISLLALIFLFATPSGRQLLFEAQFTSVALSLFTFLVTIAPLGWSIYKHPEIIKTLLGVTDSMPTIAAVTERAISVARGFFDVVHPQLGENLLPYLSLPALLFAVYGFIRLCWKITTPRYALIVSWFVAAIVAIILFNAPTAVMFVPLALLTIFGFYFFTRHWYELFPRNPYARMTALLPIAALLLIMMQFNFDRYFYGLPRSKTASTVYDADLKIAKQQLENIPPLQSGVIVVPPEKQAFFGLLQKKYATLRVISSTQPLPAAPVYLISTAANIPATDTALQNRSLKLVTNSNTDESALRFKLYR